MHFVIAGKINCPQFVYATMIAQRLKEQLPDFTYLKIAKESGDWEKWLLQVCKENEWYHIQSPIIWREISKIKGKKYYIGEVNKFLDICQDVYGMTRQILSGESFRKQEIDWFVRRTELEYFEDVRKKAKSHLDYRCRKVCIFGAAFQSCDVLIMEMLRIPSQNRQYGMEIRLYDEPWNEEKLELMAEDAKHCLGYSGLGSCRVVTTLRDALYRVDLVIVLDSFTRKPGESIVKWLKRNRNAMCALGKGLNKYARTHCRVIIGSQSNQPICYNATVLASYATKLHVRNIVAVTQDLGREALQDLSKKTGVPLKDFYCPPVWGFVGLNKFVDLRRTLLNFHYQIPGPRWTTKLPQGTDELEIRTAESLLTSKDIDSIFVSIANRKTDPTPRRGRLSQLAKITAILDLLKLWHLEQEDGNGEILTLGVYSDGTFNIPEGVYWSQPVTLEKGFWKPFAKYPTKVKIRKQRDPKPVSREKNPRKFNMNSLKQAVKMPVIRTEEECLSWLKHLSQLELGIDFDTPRTLTTIPVEPEEESSLETVAPDDIYCECWRQELRQLRRIAFEPSSTTEEEVDIVENISGSEWPVVNPSESCSPSKVSISMKALESSSESVICGCGEDCQCLECKGERTADENTEELEADISQEKDFLDRDMTKVKEVSFDPKMGSCAGRPKGLLRLYGTKDAIVDDVKTAAMRRRIKRYEDGGVEEKEDSGEVEDSGTTSEAMEFLFFEKKFHMSLADGMEIIGDPEGLEALELRNCEEQKSAEDFTKMWEDEVTPKLQFLSSNSDSESKIESLQTKEELSDEPLMAGEYELELDRTLYRSNLEVIPEGEEDEGESLKLEVKPAQVEEEPTKAPPEKKRKWEGIPKCCFCHCIIPEGELGCHCGETKIKEVFKKNSVEAMAESEEEEMSLIIESIYPEDASSRLSQGQGDTLKDRESEGKSFEREEEKMEAKSEGSEEEFEGDLELEEEPEEKRNISSLPPESFFPFSPKAVNKFTCSKRPPEMCEEATEKSFISQLPPEFLEAMKKAEVAAAKEWQSESDISQKKAIPEDAFLSLLQESKVLDETMTTSLHPVENWRASLVRKYEEWFRVKTPLRDDMYYQVAVAEVSDDEFENAEELKQYFED